MTLITLSKAIAFLSPMVLLPANAQHIFVENNSTHYVSILDAYYAREAFEGFHFFKKRPHLRLRSLEASGKSSFLLQQRTTEDDTGRPQCLYYDKEYAKRTIAAEKYRLIKAELNHISDLLGVSVIMFPSFAMLIITQWIRESLHLEPKLEAGVLFSLKNCPETDNFDKIPSGFVWSYLSLDNTPTSYFSLDNILELQVPDTYSNGNSAEGTISGRCLVNLNHWSTPLLCKIDTNNWCSGTSKNIFTNAKARDCLYTPNQVELGCLTFDYIPLDRQPQPPIVRIEHNEDL